MCSGGVTRGPGVRGGHLRVSKRVTQREQSSHIYPRQQAGIKLQRNRFAFGEEKYSELNIGKILQLRHLLFKGVLRIIRRRICLIIIFSKKKVWMHNFCQGRTHHISELFSSLKIKMSNSELDIIEVKLGSPVTV